MCLLKWCLYFKGDILPTVGGGTAVCFNDVETVTHESPVSQPREKRPSQPDDEVAI